ncbi:hypothetical protein SRABI128_05449 [Microbacterium sp. Bi128]|nr:hypothetical protein SRABI128_05449 [Microbacterium sp. Bi128]
MSHWMEARIESFCPIGVAVTPAVPAGTRKPRTPSSVMAHTTSTPATEASPIQRFAPSRIQPASSPEPSRRAKVFIEAGSEPAVGSVRANAPISSPAAIRGSHSCFWSSEPHLWMAVMAREPCTETNVRTPESPASSSIAARPYSTAERPGQP